MVDLAPTYRAVWRWHFYAGLIVMPVLMLMALTGGLYLFKPEIETAVYRQAIRVQPQAEQASPDLWVSAAEAPTGGKATSVRVPMRPDEAVRVKAGEETVFVDPHTARVTGRTGGEGMMETVKRLHSLELLGKPFNILVEIVAGWAIILVATGVYLWWPRGRDVAVAAPRLSDPKRRPFWRDLHAVTGIWVGGIVVFLAVTGMPWSAVWGDKFLNVMREGGYGRPAAPAAANPWSHGKDHDKPAGTGWTMEGAVLHAPGHGQARLSRVIAAAESHGMAGPYTVSIPDDPTLAFTVSRETTKAEQARSLYVDGRTGAVRADIRWEQFGSGAKAFEWGIAVHQGLQYGGLNRTLMLIGCIGVWVLGISGLTMWWKRRPKRGGLGAPPAPVGPRAKTAVMAIVLPLAALYPLTGLSLVMALGADAVWRRVRR